MKQLRALLVGVTNYTEIAPDPLVATDRPSAALDVATMMELIDGLCPRRRSVAKGPLSIGIPVAGARFSDAEVWALTDPSDTQRDSVLKGLRWLFDGATQEHHLLFYFSGHGMLVNNASSGRVEEVLLPSDTDWAKNFLRDEDVLGPAWPALDQGAGLDVVLEACSAMAFYQNPPVVFPFGCFLGNSINSETAAAVWGAAQLGQSSFSGPVPACQNMPIQGLFTRFFCDNFRSAKSRQGLLTDIGWDLSDYSNKLSRCCRKKLQQIPGLFCPDKMAALKPLTGSGKASNKISKGSCGAPRQPHL